MLTAVVVEEDELEVVVELVLVVVEVDVDEEVVDISVYYTQHRHDGLDFEFRDDEREGGRS